MHDVKRSGIRYAFALLAALVLSPVAAPHVRAAVTFTNYGTESGWSASTTAGKSYNIQEIGNPVRVGSTALRFEVNYGEPDPGGRYHSEFRKDNLTARGQTRWFGLSSYIPSRYGTTNGGVVMQLFDRPGGKPVIMFRADGASDQWQMRMIWGPNPNERSTIVVPAGALGTDTWTDWVFKVKSASDGTGYVRAWRNSTPVNVTGDGYLYKGPNAYATTGAIDLRIGVYAPEWSDDGTPGTTDRKRVVATDEIRVATATGNDTADYNAVRPGQ